MKDSIQQKYNLPDEIKVTIKKSKHGFYAYLDDYTGCMTVAKSIGELIENVNDAVLTYFEVPREVAKNLGFVYLPEVLHKKNEAFEKHKDEEYKPLRFAPISTQCLYA